MHLNITGTRVLICLQQSNIGGIAGKSKSEARV
jgi:hypothetical protein